ncbi:MAG: hypothetical protein ACKPJJ_00945, partial [Planctomycetaceae bacterium]
MQEVRRGWNDFEVEEEENREIAVRQLYAGLGPVAFLNAAMSLDYEADPTLVTEFLVQAAAAGQPVSVAIELSESLPGEPDPQRQAYLQYLRCLVLGSGPTPDAAVIQELQSLYQTADNAGVHAAAGWALRQHRRTMEELETLIAGETERQLTGSRDWYVSAAVTGQPAQAGVVAAPGFT